MALFSSQRQLEEEAAVEEQVLVAVLGEGGLGSKKGK